MRREARTALMVLTVVALVIAALLLVRDVHSAGTNCGSALFARDTSALSIESGDPAHDDFIEQVTSHRCDRLIFRQRYLAVLALVIAGVSGLVAKRLRPVPDRFPGDPII